MNPRILNALRVMSLCLTLAPAALAAAPAPAVQTRYPLSVTDDSGNRLILPARLSRIVSLTLPTDEILLSLLDPSRLSAVSALSADPGVSNVAAQASRVPRKMTLSVEPLVALHPDLVLTASWSDAAIVAQLREAGVPVYLIASPTNVDGVEKLIERLALLTGETARGADLVSGMEEKLRAVAEKTATIPPQKRLRVIDYTTFGASMGKGSSWDDVVKRAGLVNAVDGLSSDRWGQVPVSTEELLTIDPDIIIIPGWVYGDAKAAGSFAASTRENPALRGLTAVRTGRVFTMPESLRTCTSQYIADAVVWLARTAYPGVFR